MADESVLDWSKYLFGSGPQSQSGSSTTRNTGTTSTTRGVTGGTTSQLEVDQAAITKMIEDVLGGTGGLADIFSNESASGIYKSTAAKTGTEDLLSKLAGEIAKITGRTVTTKGEEETTDQTIDTTQQMDSKTKSKSSGILSGLF